MQNSNYSYNLITFLSVRNKYIFAKISLFLVVKKDIIISRVNYWSSQNPIENDIDNCHIHSMCATKAIKPPQVQVCG